MAAHKDSILTRYSVIVGFMLVVMLAVLGKAIYIITVEGDEWRRLVKTLRREDLSIAPKRGDLLSCDGRVMSSSIPSYQLIIDWKTGGFRDSLLHQNIDSLSLLLSRKIGDRTPAGYKQYLRSLYAGRVSSKRNVPLTTRRVSHVDLKEIRRYPLFRLGPGKSGLIASKRMQRVKPFGSLASRTIGDIYPDMMKGGKNGLELAYDSLLRGVEGVYTRRKIGNKWTEIPNVEPIDGYDIVTTIDVEVQDIAEQALRNKLIETDAESGTFVLMDTKSGEIKAMSSLDYKAPGLYAEEFNHAVGDELEPGSTFKVASLMAALETGKISLCDSFHCMNGSWRVGGATMTDHNRDKGGYGMLSVEEILWYSSNIGTAKAVLEVFGDQPDKFVDALYDMKLNQAVHLELPGAGRPKIHHPKSSRTWSKTSLPWMSFGYELQIPPIYTLMFYNAIANDGKMIKPILVRRIQQNGQTIQSLETSTINPSICSSSTLKQIKQALRGVVTNGTGKAVDSELVPIAGKTGTALISQQGGYKAQGKRYQVSFCGYFPADNPQYSAIVVIRRPRGIPSGGTMAGGVFKTVAEQITAITNIQEAEEPQEGSWTRAPHVKNGRYEPLKRLLSKLDLDYTNHSDHKEWVASNTSHQEVSITDIALPENLTPSVVGMGARDALYLLEGLGYRVSLSGRGKVKQQSIARGTAVVRGKTIQLTLH